MDDPAIDPQVHRDALRGLARLNRAAGVTSRLLAPLLSLARERGTRTLRVMDAASGGGDNALALVRAARRHGIALDVVGIDSSSIAVELARERARNEIDGGRATFEVGDLLGAPWPRGFDAVVSTLFLHHLDDGRVRAFLSRCAESGAARVVIHDLERSARGLHLARWVPRVLTRSSVVHFDAVCSVRAALTAPELMDAARDAGIANARVVRRFPARIELHGSAR